MPALDRPRKLDLGAVPTDSNAVSFRVWAPERDAVAVRIVSSRGNSEIPLARDAEGHFGGVVEKARPGDRYVYVLDGGDSYPDPASRFQPEGVHGPSQIVDPQDFPWRDEGWKGRALKDFIIYEVHVGTFTGEGTFESIIPRLDYLADLGITALEVMPVAQFPGNRNWGYDGVYPFAPQNTYGGPAGMKQLVNAAHRKGLAVVLDVVYNHLGPEGNYLGRFAPYFSSRCMTPWGEAINFDGPESDGVRRFFIDNAIYWIREFHVDALRLDAVHGIFDFGACHFLKELCEAVHLEAMRLRREVPIIAESALNDSRIIDPPECGGYGLDGQWNDDFHHSLHTLITGERDGYYEDFGEMGHLEKAYREGFVYTGQYSRYRRRRHGNSAVHRPAHQFIVYSQSHDQVGNRMAGDRLSRSQPIEKLKLAAGLVILSPFIPLLFMGEEYGETAPFCYFTSHSDPALVRSVREGREREFASFEWKGGVRDPQDEGAFLDSKLTHDLARDGTHEVLYGFYRELIRLRNDIPALRNLSKEHMEVRGFEDDKTLYVRRLTQGDEVFSLYHFGDGVFNRVPALPQGRWEKVIDSSARRWGGSGETAPARLTQGDRDTALCLPPHSFVLYRISEEE